MCNADMVWEQFLLPKMNRHIWAKNQLTAQCHDACNAMLTNDRSNCILKINKHFWRHFEFNIFNAFKDTFEKRTAQCHFACKNCILAQGYPTTVPSHYQRNWYKFSNFNNYGIYFNWTFEYSREVPIKLISLM